MKFVLKAALFPAPYPLRQFSGLKCHDETHIKDLRQNDRAPYSPDLNPIELAFAKLKALLRKAAERTMGGLWDRIGAVLDAFTPQECANYFRHDGYAPA